MVELRRNLSPLALALLINALVLPGLGQIYLKKKLRGFVFSTLSLLIVMAGFARYMSVLFATANLPRHSSRHLNVFSLFGEAWRVDHRILLAFLIALLLVWLLSILDILLEKEVRDEI